MPSQHLFKLTCALRVDTTEILLVKTKPSELFFVAELLIASPSPQNVRAKAEA